jgi:NADPH-dependent glutamate synthase beta subunit-like oxidoreductase
VADDETMATNLPGVFAGGDAVTGAATVILAIGRRQESRPGDRRLSGGKSYDRSTRPASSASTGRRCKGKHYLAEETIREARSK